MSATGRFGTRRGAGRRRARARLRGTVQGVGFRPYVLRLATSLELGGYVLNDERGVLLEVEGPPDRVEQFLGRLPGEAPPLATVESVSVEDADPRGEERFRIFESERTGEPEALVTPDAATCEDCLRELFDPRDRRHRYPFINCTNCGPRFTIVRGVPYDRPQTTMASFRMCVPCRAEYEDPGDRRFHAQPNACPDCGPRARLVDREGREAGPAPRGGVADAVSRAAAALDAGAVLAVKGLGGYHLACDAADEKTVGKLRSRKYREDKPFALMAPDLGTARELVELSPAEEALLSGRERPIVVARRRPGAAVASAVAPRSRDLGLMLPYSPLHHLLLGDARRPLVMTSGNVSDEPIAFEDGEARERLAAIADLFLVHDRPIQTRTDDSVLRALDPAVGPEPLLLRRSRGYVPASIELPLPAPRPLLGCGAELKNTFCVAKRRRAWVGHHIGDLRNYETLRSYTEGIEHFKRLFAVEPAVVAHDLHPDYLSSRYASEVEDVELVGVQHHHAHFAACLAEHGGPGPAVGAIFDGSGYGPDGTVWGGEILSGAIHAADRAGMLFPVRLPGGDAAAREPWRMACAWLAAATGEAEPALPAMLAREVDPKRWSTACELVQSGLNSPLTSSVGRLFDAVAAICGLRPVVNYEGQAAAELEGIAESVPGDGYPIEVIGSEAGVDPGLIVIDPRGVVRAVHEQAERGVDPGRIAARFHEAVAQATARACGLAAARNGTELVALSGGVFQNRLLLERTVRLLVDAGLRPLIPLRLPPNDGGIAYGQVAVAAARMA